jgi:hypothetical protein
MTVDRAVSERIGSDRILADRPGTQRAKVFIYADDPISQAGVASQLRPRPEVHVVDAAELDPAEVAVVVVASTRRCCGCCAPSAAAASLAPC